MWKISRWKFILFNVCNPSSLVEEHHPTQTPSSLFIPSLGSLGILGGICFWWIHDRFFKAWHPKWEENYLFSAFHWGQRHPWRKTKKKKASVRQSEMQNNRCLVRRCLVGMSQEMANKKEILARKRHTQIKASKLKCPFTNLPTHY